MQKTPKSIIFSILLVFLIIHPGSGLNSESILRLKEAGVSDLTIQVIVQEKAIETAAFTVAEIVDMKRAGLREKTIRMVIRENSFIRNAKPIVYGKDIRSIRFTTARDIIELKNAGVSDEVLQHAVLMLKVIGRVQALFDTFQGSFCACNFNALRMLQDTPRQFDYGVVHCRRKQERLASRRRTVHNFLHILDKSHIEHTVGLIQHQ